MTHRCNRCIFEEMLINAKKRSVKVFTWEDSHGWITAKYTDRRKPTIWFMKLPDECVCN